MTSDRFIEARFDRERARRQTAAKPETAATPQQKLVRAAETGRFEAIVASAQPAEPPKMVTPEEREAELRRTDQWPDESKPKGKAAEPEPAAEPGRELTPNEQYIAEHCRWRRRGPRDARRIPYGRCLTEYDVFTGKLIGDGYRHYEGDDEW
jgi:hypothetical protein